METTTTLAGAPVKEATQPGRRNSPGCLTLAMRIRSATVGKKALVLRVLVSCSRSASKAGVEDRRALPAARRSHEHRDSVRALEERRQVLHGAAEGRHELGRSWASVAWASAARARRGRARLERGSCCVVRTGLAEVRTELGGSFVHAGACDQSRRRDQRVPGNAEALEDAPAPLRSWAWRRAGCLGAGTLSLWGGTLVTPRGPQPAP